MFLHILHKRLAIVAGVVMLLPLTVSVVSAGPVGPATPEAQRSHLYQQAQQPQPTPSTEAVKPRLLTDPVAAPQQAGVQWFSPTGHTLRGSFLDYWNNNGGLAQFGYPLTEEFTEPIGPDGGPIMVQYFERNRFEHHPENAGTPYEVLLGTLGREFHTQDPPAPALPSPATYFSQTGHNLSGTFKTYWEAHGGLAMHGYPITEQLDEKNPLNGKTYTVQYFERSRFELHPENAGSLYEVLLGQLGTQLAQKRGYPYGWYPAYGRAADWSWLSGRMGLWAPPGAAFPWQGCAFFHYSQTGEHVQLNASLQAQGRIELIGKRDSFFIAFGRLALPNDLISACSADPNPTYYIFDRIQALPGQ
jgi:hypothetical protein